MRGGGSYYSQNDLRVHFGLARRGQGRARRRALAERARRDLARRRRGSHRHVDGGIAARLSPVPPARLARVGAADVQEDAVVERRFGAGHGRDDRVSRLLQRQAQRRVNSPRTGRCSLCRKTPPGASIAAMLARASASCGSSKYGRMLVATIRSKRSSRRAARSRCRARRSAAARAAAGETDTVLPRWPRSEVASRPDRALGQRGAEAVDVVHVSRRTDDSVGLSRRLVAKRRSGGCVRGPAAGGRRRAG